VNLFAKRRADKKLCALHIDDSRWIRIPVSVLLRRHFGMRVLEAESGQEGLRMAEVEQPDLIILDIMMPVMDGFDTLAQLKRNERTKDIPVLMCTSREMTHDVNLALRLGAAGYLTKPVEEENLVARVQELLVSMGKWGKVTASPRTLEPSLYDRATERIIPADAASSPSATSPPVTPVEPSAATPASARPCPSCQTPLSYISQYSAWYCYPCRKYPDLEAF